MVTRTLRSMSLTLSLLSCVALFSATAASAQSRSPYSGIVVFGTSLSDSGNAFYLRGNQATPWDFTLDPLFVPSAPYARGGHHFSNGATWIEQYARSIGLAGSARPALASEGAGTNYAVGGARAYEDGINFNLGRQVDTFIADVNGYAPSDALYVIEMGGNDVRDAFAAFASNRNGGAIISAALASIAVNIQKLYAVGARNFLVVNAPNISLTPAIRTFGPLVGAQAAQLTQGFNGALVAQVLAPLSGLPGAQFTVLDSYAMLTSIVGAPASFGLTTVTTACVTKVAPYHCEDADEYLFWDGIHPTKAGHAILAAQAANVLR